MRFVAAYLMATMGGNPSPTKDDVRAILGAVGADVDEDKLDLLFARIADKDVTELIAVGREKFAFASCGGGVAAPADGGAGGAAAEEEEEKAEAKVVMEEEEEGLGFSLFDEE